jgi:hypothetical protein
MSFNVTKLSFLRTSYLRVHMVVVHVHRYMYEKMKHLLIPLHVHVHVPHVPLATR